MRHDFVPDPRLAPFRKKSKEDFVDIPVPFSVRHTQQIPLIRLNRKNRELCAKIVKKHREYLTRPSSPDTHAKRYIMSLVASIIDTSIPRLPPPSDDCPFSTLFSAYKVIRSYAEEDGESVSGGTGFA